MDRPQYSSVMACLAAVPDPRQPRGKQLEWAFIWGVIVSGLLHQHRTPAAIAQWATRHAVRWSPPSARRGRVPSDRPAPRVATRRCGRPGSPARALACPRPAPPTPPRAAGPRHRWQTCARGRRAWPAHGAGQPGGPPRGQVVAQTAVAHKRHESSAVPPLLAGRDLHGMVITMDAGLTQPKLATQILAQGGHYLMVVKRNRRQLYDELTWFFDTPPLPCDRPWRE